MSTSRPFGITLLSAYYLITGLVGLVVNVLGAIFGAAFCCLGAGLLIGSTWRVITSILSVVLGASLYSGKNWAPMVGTLIAGLSALLSIGDVLSTGGIWPIVNIIVNVAVILYLQSENVKRFFATN